MAPVTTKQPDATVNLLPGDIRTEQNVKRRFNIAVGVAIALLVVLAVITVVVRLQIRDAENELADEEARAASLRTQVAALREFEELKLRVDGARASLATALAGDVSWTGFLDDLDRFMPSDSWLTSVNVSATPGTTPDGQVSLGTVQYQGNVGNMPGLANWLDTMSEIEGQQFVYLSNGSRGSGGIVSFSASSFLNENQLSHRCETEASPCP
jgi:Tfp pilus assembly protein PilN